MWSLNSWVQVIDTIIKTYHILTMSESHDDQGALASVIRLEAEIRVSEETIRWIDLFHERIRRTSVFGRSQHDKLVSAHSPGARIFLECAVKTANLMADGERETAEVVAKEAYSHMHDFSKFLKVLRGR